VHRERQFRGIGVVIKPEFRNVGEEVTVPKGIRLLIAGTARKPDVVDVGEEGEG